MHGALDVTNSLPLFEYRQKRRWPSIRVARLKALWRHPSNFTAEEVSKALSEEFRVNISRSAVLSKIARLGLVGRRRAGINVGGCNPNKGPVGCVSPWTSSPDAFLAFGSPVTLQSLSESTCRWPVGDPKEPDFAFCGAQPFRKFVYCECHARLAYQIS